MQEFNRNELQSRRLIEFEPKKPVTQEQQPDEYYDDEIEPGLFERFRFIVPVIVIAIISFIAYSWYTDKFAISKSDAELLVIKADATPLREKPEDPGGMKIINRDKKVYDAISGKDTDKVVADAKILPAPEEPISRDEIAKQAGVTPEVINNIPEKNAEVKKEVTEAEITKIETAAAPQENNNTTQAEAATPTSPATTEVATENTIQQEKDSNGIPDRKDVKQEQPSNEKVQIKEVTTADITDVSSAKKSAPSKVKKDTGYKVQLGSYRSEGDASDSLKTMKKKFSDIKDFNYYIEKADLGEKGIYYRLQLYGFKSESDARKLCQKLTDKKQGCFFVGK